MLSVNTTTTAVVKVNFSGMMLQEHPLQQSVVEYFVGYFPTTFEHYYNCSSGCVLTSAANSCWCFSVVNSFAQKCSDYWHY